VQGLPCSRPGPRVMGHVAKMNDVVWWMLYGGRVCE